MITHIFTDMDGTLLNSKGEIEKETKDIILQKQIPVTLVSARAPMEMLDAINELELDGVHIGFNGGIIFKYAHSKIHIVDEKYLNYNLVKKLITLIKLYFPELSLSIYNEYEWFSEKIDSGIKYETNITKKNSTIVNFKTFLKEPSQKIFKIMMITFDSKIMEKLKCFLKSLDISGITIQQSGSFYLEITATEAKKSYGINYIIQAESLSTHEIAGFGDSENDLPMLDIVGHPIVMENADDSIKEKALHVTKSNNENGVGYGIQKFLLNK